MKKVIAHLFFAVLLGGCSGAPTTGDVSTKLIQLEEVSAHRTAWDQSVVLVGGCFDLLHYGHIQYLHKSKEHGAFLVVALEPDESILSRKKKKPFHTQIQRAYNLASLQVVDRIILLPILKSYEDYLALVKAVRPSIIAITPDNPQRSNLERQAEIVGAKVQVVAPFLEGLSSTELKKYLMTDTLDRAWCGHDGTSTPINH
jgi:FAD synthetase